MTTTYVSEDERKGNAYLPTSELQYSPYFDKAQTTRNEDYETLKSSIGKNGIIIPVFAYKTKDNTFQLLFGNKRLHAARELGLDKVPVLIFENIDQMDAALFNLIENTHRLELAPKQKALALKDVYAAIGLTPDEALKLVYQKENRDYKDYNLRTEVRKSSGPKPRTIPPEFDEVFHKVGFAAVTQRKLLQLVTGVEPDVLDHADKKGLNLNQCALLTNSRLREMTWDKKENKWKKGSADLKKCIAAEMAGEGPIESKKVLDRGIRQVLGGAYDIELDSKDIKRLREEAQVANVREGDTGATKLFWRITDCVRKKRMAIVPEYQIAKGETFYEYDEERLKREVRIRILELSKVMEKDKMLYSLTEHIRQDSIINEVLLEVLEGEIETRDRKNELMQK